MEAPGIALQFPYGCFLCAIHSGMQNPCHGSHSGWEVSFHGTYVPKDHSLLALHFSRQYPCLGRNVATDYGFQGREVPREDP